MTHLTPKEVEEYVLRNGKFRRAAHPTETVVSFETFDKRQFALTLRDKVPRVWLEHGDWLTSEIEALFPEVDRYPPTRSKHPNIERNAPRLAQGNSVVKIVVPTIELLQRLLVAYELRQAPKQALRSVNTADTEGAKSGVGVEAWEGVLREVTHWAKGRNRKIRNEKIAKSDGSCECCEVNYSALFEGMGSRVLQVHHRKQLALADEPQLTSIADLAVVCSNCHALIHANLKLAVPVEELRERWRSLRHSN